MNKFSNQLNLNEFRTSTLLATLFIFALACYDILSKYNYAHPPIGVPSVQLKKLPQVNSWDSLCMFMYRSRHLS